VAEDFETSIELFSRVLAKYLVPLDEVKRLIREARVDGYKLLREVPAEVIDLDRLRCDIPGLEVSTIAVSEDSPAVGLSLEGIHLRNEYGVTLVAIRREKDVIHNPSAETLLLSGDVVMLLGYPEGIERAFRLFQPSSNQHNQSQASP
jgi:CPA2 family monovalent cation:H+ antiporter-2